MPYVVKRTMSIQYDGTNGAEICGEWSGGGLTLVSDDGETLVVNATEEEAYEAVARVGDWIVATPPSWVTALGPAAYAANWLELP